VSAATFDWESERRRGLRRTVAISATAHALLVAFFLVGPTLNPSPARMPSVVTVELVAAPPAAAPRPAPRPVAPPSPRKVVLPARPERTIEPAPVLRPEPKPEPVEEEYEDLLEKLRAEAGETRPEPEKPPPPPPTPTYEPPPRPATSPATRAAASPAPTGGAGRIAPPEVVAWVRDARIHVRRHWVLAAGFRMQALETHVEVELDAAGNLEGEPRITRRSGNPWYDESVVRAIEKADPLPAPPEAGTWPFVFRPEDY
jgi:TonB family protein